MILEEGKLYIHNPITGQTVPYEEPTMTLSEVQNRLKQAEHSIKTLTAALEAERERARDRLTVWDHYAKVGLAAAFNEAEADKLSWEAAITWSVEAARDLADAMMVERKRRQSEP